jgi:ferritin-like metal-binding protein YciE
MAIDSLQDLFVLKLQMMYDAERQGLDAMSRLAQQVGRPEVRQAFEKHRSQTEQQVRRLEQLFQQEGLSANRQESIAMRALIQEAEQQVGQIKDESTRDAFLIAAQQAIEHKEIADYGTARTWARQLGRAEAATLLQQTLDEEEQADRLLTQLAERLVNVEAAQRDTARSERDVTRPATAGDRSSATAGDASSRRERTSGDDVRDVGA